MRALFEAAREKFGEKLARWDTLSMGMSADYALAVREGATMVRVGSALFKDVEGVFAA